MGLSLSLRPGLHGGRRRPPPSSRRLSPDRQGIASSSSDFILLKNFSPAACGSGGPLAGPRRLSGCLTLPRLATAGQRACGALAVGADPDPNVGGRSAELANAAGGRTCPGPSALQPAPPGTPCSLGRRRAATADTGQGSGRGAGSPSTLLCPLGRRGRLPVLGAGRGLGAGLPPPRWLCGQEKAHLLAGPVSFLSKGGLEGPDPPRPPTHQIRASWGGDPDFSLSQGWGAPRTNQETGLGLDPRSRPAARGPDPRSHRCGRHSCVAWPARRAELRWGWRAAGACRLRPSPVPSSQLRADPQPRTCRDGVCSHPEDRCVSVTGSQRPWLPRPQTAT